MLWGLAIVLAAAGYRGEGKRSRYVQGALRGGEDGASPAVTVIVPVKGWDEGLQENLAALGELDYPDYELIVVSKSEGDLPEGVAPGKARVVYSGENADSRTGEKIHNLLAGVGAARAESEVFAFADSDGRVTRRWLRALVTALKREGAGAATGYRWHLPERPGFWSLVRSAWNAVIAGGFGSQPCAFAWGGAMAIRREVFAGARVAEFWKGAISDDYRLSAAVQQGGLKIVYAPGAMTPCVDGTGGGEFLGWIRRQMMITRFYAPRLWWTALVAHVLYCGAMGSALVCALKGSGWGAAALAAQVGLGMGKGWLRLRLAKAALPEYGAWWGRWGWIHVVMVPVATWAWLWGCVGSAVGRTIVWRGYRYRMGG